MIRLLKGWDFRVQDLYHELHALDRFRTDLKRKQQEESAGAGDRGGAFEITSLKREFQLTVFSVSSNDDTFLCVFRRGCCPFEK